MVLVVNGELGILYVRCPNIKQIIRYCKNWTRSVSKIVASKQFFSAGKGVHWATPHAPQMSGLNGEPIIGLVSDNIIRYIGFAIPIRKEM